MDFKLFLAGLSDQKMVIQKERKHDLDDVAAVGDAGYVASLWGCGLLKFFWTPNMISHPCLLEHILHMWNPEQQYFQVGIHVLTIEVEDIYFLMRLSRRGAPISLTSLQGGTMTTQEMINDHCHPGMKMSGNKISISVVVDMPLRIVLFIMQRLVGNQGPHQ